LPPPGKARPPPPAGKASCFRAANFWPVQTCERLPAYSCNGASNEYRSFEQCCARSFRSAAGVVRGDGLDNMECFLVPGVWDPPCYVAEPT
jgi:hypothetical protein